MESNLKYQELSVFPKLIKAFLSQNEDVRSLYNNFPTLNGFENQIKSKMEQSMDRSTLVEVVKAQYQAIENTEFTIKNLTNLLDNKTFTVTTGHQLNLFSGPVYFIYKIASTIKLALILKSKFPEYQFVPIYWMASEDHDFDEINHLYVDENQKIEWNVKSEGAVGKIKIHHFDDVFTQFEKTLDSSVFSTELRELMLQSYQSGLCLSDATRRLVHHLFGKYGLIIIDADHKDLKRAFIPYIKKEIENQVIFNEVNTTNVLLKKHHFEVQVNPREINLFYLKDNLRERLIQNGDFFKVNNTDLVFSKKELWEEIDNFPERFSPNVLLRPVYQEVILPNLSVIGGAGEISYWLQNKTTFDSFHVTFPILVVRNSVLWVTEKQIKKWTKMGLEASDFLVDINEVISKIIKHNEPEDKPDFTLLESILKDALNPVLNWTEHVEPTYISGIKATLQKQLNEWQNWEQKLHKALKKKNADAIERAEKIRDEIYPSGNLQERFFNFSFFYQKIGPTFIDVLIDTFDPLCFEYEIMEIPNP